jgi:hypothetical protein
MRIETIAVGCFCLLLTLVGKAADDQKEPVHEGKTLSEWIKAITAAMATATCSIPAAMDR